MRAFPIEVGGGVATCVRVQQPDSLPAALALAGLGPPRPVVVVVGGASGLGDANLERLAPLFADGLVPALERAGAIAVDGGTNAGVMRLLGEARLAQSRSFPLVGVTAEGTVRLPGDAQAKRDASDLEPHHSHFILVPGAEWGDESVWIALTATHLANGSPSMTVLVNGGDIAYADALRSVQAGRPLVVVAGTGRAADEIAAAIQGEPADQRAEAIAASDLVTTVAADDPWMLLRAVTTALAPASA
ncbi:hypothetical protein [Pedococcus sp. 5OH_020]|uniref:hypothetical protein n=1 Tax=Pedococcus sp. 5OH_020 TaxID=2989814 RepID=UPI0022E9EB69|nr:hypothetical protein [Pedococcus sp. 5OH_020]